MPAAQGWKLSRVARIFIDAEFKNLPWTGHGDLLWLGLADEAGRSWSAVNAEVDLDHASRFTLDVVVPKMSHDEPRLRRTELAAAVIAFCGEPDEFWAWCPTVDQLHAFGLTGSEALGAYRHYWDWDFQLVRSAVEPWPPNWPTRCHDLQDYALRARIELPPNPGAHHPRLDALWNLEVFKKAQASA